MYSSIYRVQSSTRRLPIRALFGFTLKLVESYLSPSPQSLCVVVCPWCQPWVASITCMILKIRGMVFCTVASLSRYVWMMSDLAFHTDWFYQPKAFKHIFTSLSSVDQEPKATHSGNARIHGMRSTTKVSIAYVAMQVWVMAIAGCFALTFPQACFALTSAQVFSRTDLVTDSEHFYNSILEILDDPEEKGKVDQLMVWWNQ